MSSNESNRYVYGIVESEDNFAFEADIVGERRDTVYTISHRNLAAVVSDIDTTEPEETDEDATRHDDVLRDVMSRDGGRTVVPMQFGMAFENDRALKNVLRNARPLFRRALRDVEGCVELGLKIVQKSTSTSTTQSTSTSKASSASTATTSSASTEPASSATTEPASSASTATSTSTPDTHIALDEEAIVESIEAQLEPVAEQSVDNELFSDRLLYNRSYLVDRNKQDRFDDVVAQLEEKFENDSENVLVRYTGPFAPYSFVDVKIGVQ